MMQSTEAIIRALLADERRPGAASTADAAGDAAALRQEPLTEETLRRLQAPFPAEQLRYHVLARATQPTRQIGEIRLPRSLVDRRLIEVLGPRGYCERFDVIDPSDPAVACHLTLGTVTRTGAGDGAVFEEAYDRAFLHAARRFGIGWQIEEAGRISMDLSAEAPQFEERTRKGLREEQVPSTLPD